MLKKIALATGVTLLSTSFIVASVNAQSLGDGDIDNIINGLVSDSSTKTTTPKAPEKPAGIGENYTATSADGTSLDTIEGKNTDTTTSTAENDKIMLEPDSTDSNLEVDTDSIIDDVMVKDSTNISLNENTAPAPSSSSHTATPRKVTSTKKLSAAGMDMVTLLVISGVISSLAGLYFVRRKKSNSN